jgi:diguanylate cyclase (GGDEF)-like protein
MSVPHAVMLRKERVSVEKVERQSSQRLPRGLSAALVVVVLGLVGASAAIGVADRADRAVLAWALLAFVAVVSFMSRRLLVGLAAGIASTAAFGVLISVQDAVAGRGPRLALMISDVVTGLTLCAMPIGIRLLMRELNRSFSLVGAQQVTTELSSRNESTGAYRSDTLKTFLQEEVERGKRGKRTFTVCLLGLDKWSELVAEVGLEGAHSTLQHSIATLGSSRRLLDKVVDLGNGEVVLLLPETPLGGAETVAWRIQSKIAAEVPVPVRIGIAEYPRDGLTDDDLMNEVRQALEFARTANIPVVDRSLLGAE